MLKEYKCRVGFALFGSSGTNVLRQLTVELSPNDYPDFNLFGGDTDGKFWNRHFPESKPTEELPDSEPIEPSNEELWQKERRRFRLHLFGEEITKGHGAGADITVGEAAVTDPKSQEALENFFKNVDEAFLVGAVGGGTGTPALIQAAKICKSLKVSATAIVIIPEVEDGLEEIAEPALEELMSLVPVTTVHNSYIDEYIDQLSAKKAKVFTQKEVWQAVNEHTTLKLITVLREIIQETGDEENLDVADWRMIKAKGNRLFFGLHETEQLKDDDLNNMTPDHVTKLTKSIMDELLAGRFQDKDLVKKAKIAGIWFHGPWDWRLNKAIRLELKERICSDKNSDRYKKFQVHRGSLVHPQDDKMWVAVILAAQDDETVVEEPQVTSRSNEFALDLENTLPPPTPVPAPVKEPEAQSSRGLFARAGSLLRKDREPAFGEVSYQVGGVTKNFGGVPRELANEFKNFRNNPNTTPLQRREILNKIAIYTKQVPDQSEYDGTTNSIH